jgi:hypothetical protein
MSISVSMIIRSRNGHDAEYGGSTPYRDFLFRSAPDA